MKGDKGSCEYAHGLDDGLTDYPEFSGTLMGFDDYVSKSSLRSFYSGR